MKLIKVGAAVLNQTPLDWSGNRDRIRAAIDQARQQQVSVLCLPELCITGYGCEDAFLAPGTHEMSEQVLCELLPDTKGMVVSLGLPRLHRGAVINTACLVVDGSLLGFVGKQNLAGDGIHYEPRWFRPWPSGMRTLTEVAGQPIPLGDLVFDVGGVYLGFEICEDAWVASRPGMTLAHRGVDVILNPSASHFAFGKHAIRQRFVLEGSRAFHTAYVYANLLGNEAGRAIYDGDAMIASAGRLQARGPRFSFADYQLTAALVDLDENRMHRAQSQKLATTPQDQQLVVESDFEIPAARPERNLTTAAAWEQGPAIKEEEFARAVALGLFDYMRKSFSKGFVVSLSGGADSAAVAALVSLAFQFAWRELGVQRLAEKLAYIAFEPPLTDPQQLVQRLLTTAYQASRHSSQTTRDAARHLATELNSTHHEFAIERLVSEYVQLIEGALHRELRWDTDDIALQNIQARVRAPSVWLLANVQGALLLATSNRSEAAVGYATMDGDTAGGLSPIAGIDKAFLRKWLRWLEHEGPEGLGPLPALALINQQQPTAELRPREYSQTDEGDLMPYTFLDAVERAAIRDKRSPLEVFETMRVEFQETYTVQQMGAWIDRFFRLWSRNQWKRERYAPSFHLDDENLDPKTWCRFPILSGGFARELEVLAQAVRDCST